MIHKLAPSLADYLVALLGAGTLPLAMGAVPVGDVDVWSLVRAALVAGAGAFGGLVAKSALVFAWSLARSAGRQLRVAARARLGNASPSDDALGRLEAAVGDALVETADRQDPEGRERPALPAPTDSAKLPP